MIATLQEFKKIFDPKLESFYDDHIKLVSEINPVSKDILIEIKNISLSGGKRFRPALVYFSYLLGKSGGVDDEIFQLGISLEIYHTFALIHDDIIDEAIQRRGYPTLEVTYQKKFEKQSIEKKAGKHLALSAAILGGDYANLLANWAFSKIKRKSEIEDLFWQMQNEVYAGQVDDTFGVGIESLDSLSTKAVLNMLDYKSGRYSIEKPLLLGAKLAGLEDSKLTVLSKIGLRVGIVFQIVDDILGMFGKEDVTGKSNISDIVEGKRTLLITKTYEKSNDEEKDKIKQVLGNKDLTESQATWLKNIIIEKGVLSELQSFCKSEIEQSKKDIQENFDPENKGTKFLLELCDYMVSRDL
jgi:geranylgeranyl diphosphate synthase type I